MKDDYREALKLSNQLCFPLYAASRNITGLYAPLLKPLGLTYTQYIVMLVLWEKDSISVTGIGERLMLDNGTLSPLLRKMEQSGLIERHRSPDDDRVVVITLTDKGHRLREKAADIPAEMGKCVKLSPEKARMLYDLLYEILHGQGYGKKLSGNTGSRKQPEQI